MKERQKHEEALEYFISLGAAPTDSNASKVGAKYGVHRNTVWRWYKELNWRNRADQRLLEINKLTREKNNVRISDVNADMLADIDQYMRIIKQSFGNALVKNKDGKMVIEISPENARDISYLVASWEKLASKRSVLMGEPSDRLDVDHTVTLEDIIKHDRNNGRGSKGGNGG